MKLSNDRIIQNANHMQKGVFDNTTSLGDNPTLLHDVTYITAILWRDCFTTDLQ